MTFSDQSNEQIMVIASIKMHLAGVEKQEFNGVTKLLIEKTKALDSPITYNCSEDIHGNGEFTFIKIWPSKAALEQHLATNHVQDWSLWVEPRLREPLNVMFVETGNIKPSEIENHDADLRT